MLYNKNIVVTCGAGFIGSHIVDKLVDLGANVIVIDNLSFGTKKYLNNYALILSIENKASISETFNLSGGFPITIRELVEKLLEILGLIGKTKVYFKRKSWEGDITKLIADISKIREKLHFKPKIDLHQGLVKLIDWFYTEGSKNGETF